jgi:cobalt-zinc-cadmium efflux system protein
VEREGGTPRLRAAFWLTALVLVGQAAGGWVSGSLALLSDAGHMMADLGGLGLALWAAQAARRPADETRSYGFARVEILAAVVNGAVLLLVAGGIVYEAVHRLANPEPIRLGVMAGVAAVGLLINAISALLLRRSSRRSLNVRGAFLHVVSDTAASAAVVLSAGIIAWTGYWRVDAAVSILIAIGIVVGAYRFLRESVDVLLESVPSEVDPAQVRQAIRAVPGVDDLHDLHIWTISSGFLAMSGHLTITGEREADAILAEANDRLARRFLIAHTTLQIESQRYPCGTTAHR